jgi:KAP family P-loop domain
VKLRCAFGSGASEGGAGEAGHSFAVAPRYDEGPLLCKELCWTRRVKTGYFRYVFLRDGSTTMNAPASKSRGTDLGSHSGDPIVLTATNDLYQYYTAAATLADTLLKSATPLVVGIYGRWGRGKTTYLDTLKDRISARSTKALHIQYSPWNFQLKSFEDVWIALITEFSSQTTKSTFSETLRKQLSEINYWKATKSVLGAGATLLPLFGEGAKKLIEGLPDGAKKNDFEQFLETKKVFDDAVNKFLEAVELRHDESVSFTHVIEYSLKLRTLSD